LGTSPNAQSAFTQHITGQTKAGGSLLISLIPRHAGVTYSYDANGVSLNAGVVNSSLIPTGDWVPGTQILGANLPLVKLDTTYNLAGQGGTVHGTSAGMTTQAEFDTAVTNAVRGDVIVLRSGFTFDKTTTRIIPAKAGTGWIYVISSDFYNDLQLKAPGQRVTVADVGNMATVRSTNTNTAAFTFNHGTSHPTHWRFVGLNITTTNNQQNALFNILGNTATTANIPEWIGLDRCRIWGTPGTVNVRRGVQMDGASCFAVDCDIIGHRDANNSDSQAIAINHAPGPLKIVNCRLQAASENFISGGSSSFRQPADVEFGLNWLDKDPAWEGVYGGIKNNWEVKFGARFYVYGCVMDYCWISGQTGPAIVVKSTSQTGVGDGAQYKTNDIIFENVLCRYYQEPFNILGSTEDSTQSVDRVVMKNVLFVQKRAGNARATILHGRAPMNGIVLKNVTLETGGTYYQVVVEGTGQGDMLIIEDCLLNGGVTPNWNGGPFGSGTPALSGIAAIADTYVARSVTGNACRSTWTAQTEPGNTSSTASTFQACMINYAGGDYGIAPGNWAKGVATGGTDPGADWTIVSTAINHTVDGQWPTEH